MISRTTTVFIFILLSSFAFAQKEFESNNLFLYLHQKTNSDSFQKLREHFVLDYPPSGGRLWNPSKGIECDVNDEEIVDEITLYFGDKQRRIFSTFESELPLNLKWGMTKQDVKKLFGDEGAYFLYHYDRNLDLHLVFDMVEGIEKLGTIVLSYHDWTPKDDIEKLVRNPDEFKYLKPTAAKTSKEPFDAKTFADGLKTIIERFGNNEPVKLKGPEISKDVVYTYYESSVKLPAMLKQEIQDFASSSSYHAVIANYASTSDEIPGGLIQEYVSWVQRVKDGLPVLKLPWIPEKEDLYLRGFRFRNKSDETQSSFFSALKYPLVRIYIDRNKTNGTYSLILQIN